MSDLYRITWEPVVTSQKATGRLQMHKADLQSLNHQLVFECTATVQDGSLHLENCRSHGLSLYNDRGEDATIAQHIKLFLESYWQGVKNERAWAWVKV